MGSIEQLPGVIKLLNENIGSALICALVVWILLGVSTLQTASYFQTTDDRPWVKSFVALIFGLDALRSILLGYSYWHFIVLNSGQLAAADEIFWGPGAIAVAQILVSLLTQLWYARRLWIIMERQPFLPLLNAFVSITTAAAGFASVVHILRSDSFLDIRRTWYFSYFFIGTFIADISVAIPVLYTLIKWKGEASEKHRTILDRLILWITLSASATAGVAIASLVIYYRSTGTLLFVNLFIAQGSLYVNFLLAFLNSRTKRAAAIRAEYAPREKQTALMDLPSFPLESYTGRATFESAGRGSLTGSPMTILENPNFPPESVYQPKIRIETTTVTDHV